VLLNPEFDSATGWATTGGWSITGGQAVNSGTNGNLQQGGKLTVGNYYIVTLEIVACSNFDDLRIRFGAASVYSLSSIGITTTGTHQIAFQAQSTFFLIQTINSATATIEFAGCEEYTPTAAELWTVEGIGNTTQLFAYSTTWYDQSGSGNDATQATAAAQPKLITLGVTELENGKPALSFDGTDDYFDISTNPISVLNNFMASVVAKPNQSSNEYGVTLSQTTERVYVPRMASGSLFIGYDDSQSKLSDGAFSASQQLITLSVDASTASGFKNGAAFSVTPTATAETAAVVETSLVPQIGALGGNDTWNGNFQEVIVYPSDQSANRTGIEGNINDHYGIY